MPVLSRGLPPTAPSGRNTCSSEIKTILGSAGNSIKTTGPSKPKVLGVGRRTARRMFVNGLVFYRSYSQLDVLTTCIPAQGSRPSNRDMMGSTFGRSQANDQVDHHTRIIERKSSSVARPLPTRPPRHATLRYDHESLRYQIDMKDEDTPSREKSYERIAWRQLRGTRLVKIMIV